VSRFFLYAVGLLVLAADQLTKFAAAKLLLTGQSRPLWGTYISLAVQRNTGAAFGLFPAATTALIALAAVIIIFIAVWGTRIAKSSLPSGARELPNLTICWQPGWVWPSAGLPAI